MAGVGFTETIPAALAKSDTLSYPTSSASFTVALLLLFVSSRLVDLIAVGEGAGCVCHHRGRSENRVGTIHGSIDGRSINERLENRSRGTPRPSMIPLAESVLSPADQSQDFAGVRINRH